MKMEAKSYLLVMLDWILIGALGLQLAGYTSAVASIWLWMYIPITVFFGITVAIVSAICTAGLLIDVPVDEKTRGNYKKITEMPRSVWDTIHPIIRGVILITLSAMLERYALAGFVLIMLFIKDVWGMPVIRRFAEKVAKEANE